MISSQDPTLFDITDIASTSSNTQGQNEDTTSTPIQMDTEEPGTGGKIDISVTPLHDIEQRPPPCSFVLASPLPANEKSEETPLSKQSRSLVADEKAPKRKHSFRFKAKDFVQRRTDEFEDHYELRQVLGEGAYGEVFVCQHRYSGTERAVKIIDKSLLIESEYEEVINEYRILKQVDHPNLIRMYEFFDNSGKFYIVQDIVKGGELFDLIEERGKLPEHDVALLMKQVLSCLKYLADENIVHRDINLENILLEEGGDKDYSNLKIIDFGLATQIKENDKLTEIVGKTYYLAPEVLEQRYGAKYDVWASGALAYVCLVGFLPFDSNTEAYVRQLIMEGDVSFNDSEWNGVSDEAKDFVAKLLTYEEDKRPSAEEALRHPWITHAAQASSAIFKKEDSWRAQTTLSNLRSFTSASSLKEATRSYIASQLLKKEERDNIDRIFREMDTDCDGKLSVHDLQTNYKEFSDSELSQDQIQELFQNCDLDGSGFIDYSEFVVAGIKDSDLLDEEKLKAAFANFDTDHSGYISADNLKQSLVYCRFDDEALGDEIIDNIISQVDRSQKGFISFEEFKDIMFQNAPSLDDDDNINDEKNVSGDSDSTKEDTEERVSENDMNEVSCQTPIDSLSSGSYDSASNDGEDVDDAEADESAFRHEEEEDTTPVVPSSKDAAQKQEESKLVDDYNNMDDTDDYASHDNGHNATEDVCQDGDSSVLVDEMDSRKGQWRLQMHWL